jgi:hypothetical protein
MFLYFNVKYVQTGEGKTKDSELNDIKHSQNLIYSEFLPQCNFDLQAR